MTGFDVNRLELIAKKYLNQAAGDRREAAQLLLRRVDSNAALKLRVMELLVEPSTWDIMRRASTDADTERLPQNEPRLSSTDVAITRKKFEAHIRKMRVLPFPGRNRKRELVSRCEDLRDRVTVTLGQDCRLFYALNTAVRSERRTDIRHVLAVYESQPYVVLDRIWTARCDT